MSYEKLLDELETLQKSYTASPVAPGAPQGAGMPEGDEGQYADLNADGEGEGEGDDEANEAKKKPAGKFAKQFAKSFTLVDEQGNEAEAIDGTALVKSLQAEVEELSLSAKSEKADLAKSIGILADVIKKQGVQIKALQEGHNQFANQGAGRKSVMLPDASMVKAMGGSVTSETFMTKAHAAFDAGRITGKELTTCSVSLRIGEAIDAGLINKIFTG